MFPITLIKPVGSKLCPASWQCFQKRKHYEDGSKDLFLFAMKAFKMHNVNAIYHIARYGLEVNVKLHQSQTSS